MNKYIKQRVGRDSLITTNRKYEKRNRLKRHKRDRRVCDVCVQLKSGSTYWVVMKYIKDSNPVE